MWVHVVNVLAFVLLPREATRLDTTGSTTIATARASGQGPPGTPQNRPETGASNWKGFDTLAFREGAAVSHPFVPRPVRGWARFGMVVQLLVSLFCGGFLAIMFVTRGTAAASANMQLAGLMVMTMMLQTSLPLYTRFLARGSYTWLFRRAFADAPRADIERHDLWLSRYAMFVLQDSLLIGTVFLGLCMVNTDIEPFSDTWWDYNVAYFAPIVIGSNFMIAVGPVLGAKLLLESLFNARIAWIRRARPPRGEAMAAFYEMHDALRVISEETSPMVLVIVGVGVADLALMTLFLVTEPITAWAPVIGVPACGGIMVLTLVIMANMTQMCENFTRKFLMLFDSLPEDTVAQAASVQDVSDSAAAGDAGVAFAAVSSRSEAKAVVPAVHSVGSDEMTASAVSANETSGDSARVAGSGSSNGRTTGTRTVELGGGLHKSVPVASAARDELRKYQRYETAGPPVTYDGFAYDVSVCPLGMRVFGTLVDFPRHIDALRAVSVLATGLALVVRSVINNSLGADADGAHAAACDCGAALQGP